MQMEKKSQILARKTRQWRRIHRYLSLSLAILLLISAITGLLLGWKKESDLIQPPTLKGTTSNMSEWKSMHQLDSIATKTLEQYKLSTTLDRVDVRPGKGIVKFQYVPGHWEVQIDAASGEVLSVEKRYSDLIEQIHDGSIISDGVKIVSMNVLGLGVSVMIISGFFLWFVPRKIRKIKHTSRSGK